MINIDTKTFEITMTRGDTLKVIIGMKQDEEPYIPAEGDVIRFYMSKKYKGETGYELLLNKIVPNETLQLKLDPEDTSSMKYGTYNYDIELTKADGDVDTFIQSKITLTEESA